MPTAPGVTRIPGRPPLRWAIRGVEPGRGYTIEGDSFLEGASLLVHWRFDPLTESTTLLTQRIELVGEEASRHVEDVRAGFGPHLEPGMRRTADLMLRTRKLAMNAEC